MHCSPPSENSSSLRKQQSSSPHTPPTLHTRRPAQRLVSKLFPVWPLPSPTRSAAALKDGSSRARSSQRRSGALLFMSKPIRPSRARALAARMRPLTAEASTVPPGVATALLNIDPLDTTAC